MHALLLELTSLRIPWELPPVSLVVDDSPDGVKLSADRYHPAWADTHPYG